MKGVFVEDDHEEFEEGFRAMTMSVAMDDFSRAVFLADFTDSEKAEFGATYNGMKEAQELTDLLDRFIDERREAYDDAVQKRKSELVERTFIAEEQAVVRLRGITYLRTTWVLTVIRASTLPPQNQLTIRQILDKFPHP